MSALAALKSHDGKGHAGDLPAYVASHRRASMHDQRGAYKRRRAAACEVLGLAVGEFNAKAERRVDELLGQHPELVGDDLARALAFGFVSHELVAEARGVVAAKAEFAAREAARLERRVALVRAALRTQGMVEACLFRVMNPVDPYAPDAFEAFELEAA